MNNILTVVLKFNLKFYQNLKFEHFCFFPIKHFFVKIKFGEGGGKVTQHVKQTWFMKYKFKIISYIWFVTLIIISFVWKLKMYHICTICSKTFCWGNFKNWNSLKTKLGHSFRLSICHKSHENTTFVVLKFRIWFSNFYFTFATFVHISTIFNFSIQSELSTTTNFEHNYCSSQSCHVARIIRCDARTKIINRPILELAKE